MRRYRRFWGFRCPPSIITGIFLAPGCSRKSEGNKSVLKSCTFSPGFSFTSMKTFLIWNPGQNKYEPRPVHSFCRIGDAARIQTAEALACALGLHSALVQARRCSVGD